MRMVQATCRRHQNVRTLRNVDWVSSGPIRIFITLCGRDNMDADVRCPWEHELGRNAELEELKVERTGEKNELIQDYLI